jgi:hypothetical protein
MTLSSEVHRLPDLAHGFLRAFPRPFCSMGEHFENRLLVGLKLFPAISYRCEIT